MSNNAVIDYLKSFKDTDALAAGIAQVRRELNNITNALVCEKAGNILKKHDLTNDICASVQFKKVKIAIISNFVCNSLENYLRCMLMGSGIAADFYMGEYNSYIFELINQESNLYAFQPDLTICLLDENILFGEEYYPYVVAQMKTQFDLKLSEIRTLSKKYVELSGSTIVFNTIPMSKVIYDQIIDYKTKAEIGRLWREFEQNLLLLAEESRNVIVLDMNIIYQRVGAEVESRASIKNFAKITLSEESVHEYAKEVKKVLVAQLGLGKKCLVLDLDNTLWGGIIADDGIENIQLGQDYPGNSFLKFQKSIKALKEQGVLLTICSKNEEEVALKGLSNHPEMQIQLKDFLVIKANWNMKSQNIEEITNQLNIGLDSIVFLDDSAFERNQVKEALDVVTVPELPADPADYTAFLLQNGWFNSIELTSEDWERTEKYIVQKKREDMRQQASSLDEYLWGLGIELYVISPDEYTLPRLVQLNARTNQFNMTTRRYTMQEMEGMNAAENYEVIGFKAKDKVGDYGLIGSVIIEKNEEHENVWYIKNLLMSCRVMSRGIEDAIITFIVDRAAAAGIVSLRGEFIPTMKNKIVMDFYKNHGFAKRSSSENITVWELNDMEYIVKTPWISIYHKGDDEQWKKIGL